MAQADQMYKAFVNWASECLEYKGLILLTPAQNVPHPKSVNRQHDSLNPFLWRACFACNDLHAPPHRTFTPSSPLACAIALEGGNNHL